MATSERPEPPVPPPAAGLVAVRARLAEAVRFHPREVVALALLGTLLVAGAGLAYVRSRPAVAVTPVEPVDVVAEESAPAEILVHVAGAVRRPGVYALADGARVIDAVQAAGGLTRKADGTAINMARPLADGEQVLVPRRAPPGGGGAGTDPPSGTSTSGGPVNINTASAGELETLPGVGPVLAQRIIDYREQHGPFRTPSDLQKVSGIGPKTFESIEPHITV